MSWLDDRNIGNLRRLPQAQFARLFEPRTDVDRKEAPHDLPDISMWRGGRRITLPIRFRTQPCWPSGTLWCPPGGHFDASVSHADMNLATLPVNRRAAVFAVRSRPVTEGDKWLGQPPSHKALEDRDHAGRVGPAPAKLSGGPAQDREAGDRTRRCGGASHLGGRQNAKVSVRSEPGPAYVVHKVRRLRIKSG